MLPRVKRLLMLGKGQCTFPGCGPDTKGAFSSFFVVSHMSFLCPFAFFFFFFFFSNFVSSFFSKVLEQLLSSKESRKKKKNSRRSRKAGARVFDHYYDYGSYVGGRNFLLAMVKTLPSE